MQNRKPTPPIIDSDGHVRETDAEIIEYMSAGYRSRRDAMLYFPLVPHHGWRRSIPAIKTSACRIGASGRENWTTGTSPSPFCSRRGSCTSARSATRLTR
jgi:hypothetical protein